MKVIYRAQYKKDMHQRIIDAWQKQYPWKLISIDKINAFAKEFIQTISEKEKEEYLTNYRQYEFYFYVADPKTIFNYFTFSEVVHGDEHYSFIGMYDLIVGTVLDWLCGYQYEGKPTGSTRCVAPPIEAYKRIPLFNEIDTSKQIKYHLLDSCIETPRVVSRESVEVFYFDLEWNIKSVTINSKGFDIEKEFEEIMKGNFLHFFGRKRSMQEAADY